MSNHELPYFGEIENGSLKEYYCVDVNLSNREIQIDINFTKKSADNEKLEIIREFLSKVEEVDRRNILEYNKDFQKEGETQEYIQFYIEELFEDELKELISVNENEEKQKKTITRKIRIKKNMFIS